MQTMEFEINERLKQLTVMLCEIDSIYQSLLATKNISDSEFVVMIAILSLGVGCLQKDIAETSYMSKKTINSSIKRLEKEGFIKLKAGKYPNMHIYLTQKGKEHIKENILPIIEVEERVLNSMSNEEFERLIVGSSKYIGLFKDQVANFIIRER